MTTDNSAPVSGSIMVVGGGISGLTTALEAAEVGYEVFLVEKEASLGGRVSQLKHYFPKLCPPTCGLEINYKLLKTNKTIKVNTGDPENAQIKLSQNVRKVYDPYHVYFLCLSSSQIHLIQDDHLTSLLYSS